MTATEVLLHEGCYDRETQKLYGNECKPCGQVFFPKRRFCPACLSNDHLEDFQIPDIGTLYSYTVIHTGPARFPAVYAVGYVDTDRKVRLFGHIAAKDGELDLGQEMKIQLGQIGREADKELLGVVFTPIKTEGEI